MFLQLLVAQLQHQDPTSPVDPSQFVGQLAQFSELSEVTSIYTLLQQVVPGVSASGSTGGSSGGASGGTQGSAGNATGGADVPANPSVASLPLVGSGANAAAPAASPNFSAPSLSDILSKLPSKIQGAF
jgi:flagellar basal-body rod modification protein FlgD